MGRISRSSLLPFRRSVKMMNTPRSFSVRPMARKRFSRCEWAASGRMASGRAKRPSMAATERPCFSHFPRLPLSQSKPFACKIMVANQVCNCIDILLSRVGSHLLQPRDLGHDCGGFFFERGAHGLIVRVRNLAGFVFEIQIAQVFVDGFLALAEVAEAGFFLSGIDFAGEEENVVERREQENGAEKNSHWARTPSGAKAPDSLAWLRPG